ncbi:MAG: L-threonylcarbamoyladenylate synthase [Bacteroidales bacterium]
MGLQEDIARAAELIREGRLVAFPTETVYGLGAHALDPMAVARIYELKERPSFDPLIVHIADLAMLQQLCLAPDPRVLLLASKFWPGPLTMVLPKSAAVPDIVTSGLSTVGIRMPGNEIALQLIKTSGCPIAAPSANKFGRLSPTSARHVLKQLPEVDFVLEGGKAQVGIESTIIRLNEKGFEILRHGIITREELEKWVPFHAEEKPADQMLAPGMMKSHYSPGKPLYLSDDERLMQMNRRDAGFLSFSGQDTHGYGLVLDMAPGGDLKEYAVNLFEGLHQLEEAKVAFMVAETVEEKGIGLAIMDRLRKAAWRYSAEQH